jgi:cytochrome P450 family 6
MSKHQDLQQRLRSEIKSILLENNGKIPYEAIAMPSHMPYLDNVVNEILRMYSIIPMLDRVCLNVDGYSMQPFSDFKIPHGMPILIPIYPLGYDEQFFTEPLQFNPLRFESIKELPLCAHIPFGTGPRACIGERLGLIQVKMAIVKILKEFRIEMSANTPKNVKLMKEAFIVMSEKPLMVNFVRDPIISD